MRLGKRPPAAWPVEHALRGAGAGGRGWRGEGGGDSGPGGGARSAVGSKMNLAMGSEGLGGMQRPSF